MRLLRPALDGLREIQRIRSKVKAHPGGTNAAQLVTAVLMEYGTYTDHFEAICRKVANELEAIEKLFVCVPFTSCRPRG